MVVRNAFRDRLATLGGSLAALGLGLLALAVAAPARAGTLVDPTDCLVRTFGSAGRVNDLVNSSPADGPETGNHLYRIDQFDIDFESECGSTEILGLSIVLKNPFDIPGPNDLDATTFPALSAQMEADFPAFDHWSGWSLPPPDTFALNQNGFHGVSVCIFTGSDAGQAGNLDDCVAGTATRLVLTDVDGQGMVFSIDLSDFFGDNEPIFLCGECDDPLEIAVVAYSNVYGNTMGVYSHPEALIGYRFTSLVPEPSLVALLGSAFAALAWRRRARA